VVRVVAKNGAEHKERRMISGCTFLAENWYSCTLKNSGNSFNIHSHLNIKQNVITDI